MPEQLLLLPTPRRLTHTEGALSIRDKKLIILDGPAPQKLRFIAGKVQQAVQQYTGANWSIVAGRNLPAQQMGLTFSVTPGSTNHPQGYQLTVTPAGIYVVGSTAAGVYYGGLTLLQIIAQSGDTLPLLYINDWPDFSNRGVMLDISRDKVPKMDTLLALVEMLASWKINQFQLYTEHTFAYQNHPTVWADASPMTGEDILTLDAYCRERFIELVPNQNTFGHMHRWLTHDDYRPLAECPHGCDSGNPEWGYFEEPFTLAPENPGSLELVRGLLDELGPHFTSRQFNVGCDEPVELGVGASKAIVAERGKGQVYLDFLLKIYREVKLRGYTMQFWGDIIMEHPELTPRLPRDIIALEWGYEADHPFDDHGAKFAASGIPFYVCPGTSSWNTIAGRAKNTLENLRNAAKNGLKHGAIGYLITDWGDYGHWQPPLVSYPGFVYGAALSWAYDANLNLDVPQTTGVYAFQDKTGVAGRLIYDLGNAYLQPQVGHIHNNSVLFRILQETPAEITARPDLTAEKLQQTSAYISAICAPLANIQFNWSDAHLLRRELQWTADMLQHACRRGIWALSRGGDPKQLSQEAGALIAEFREIWLARNRPGGLQDSVARLEKMRRDYDDTTKLQGHRVAE